MSVKNQVILKMEVFVRDERIISTIEIRLRENGKATVIHVLHVVITE